MKRLVAIVLALVMIFPMNVSAQERNWWPTQIDEWDEFHDIEVFGKWPSDVLTKETAIDTITFSPAVIAVEKQNKSAKVLIDATTASRVIIVKYTVDGKTWLQKSYRNTGYKNPVICIRKWQIKLHSKEDYRSSTCARQFKQGKTSLNYKKVFKARSAMAQLYFDDVLINSIRKKVFYPVILNIPARVKKFKIRYAYTGLKKECFSEWVEVKVK